MTLSEEIASRGYVHQITAENLAEIVESGKKRTVYLGVDPTGDSLHVGHLVTYMLARALARAGHRIILLVGGGTGMIGDPKPDVERPLLDEDTVQRNVAALSAQVKKVVGIDDLLVVNNADWLRPLPLIDFLRDTGKHFTVNNLIKKDAIAERLKSDTGITYTEFAYPLLQAYDFLHLHTEHACDVQIGGSDQWGNITAGVDLIRRKTGDTVFGITVPLVVDKATGKKFGKSEGNAIWLDQKKTSPFHFYQFWLNTSDESVEDYLKLFTELSLEEVAAVMSAHDKDRGKRAAQEKLAYEITALIHGSPTADGVLRVSQILFSNEYATLTPVEYDLVKQIAPRTQVSIGTLFTDVLVEAGLANSKREAREFLSQGAISLNGEKIDERTSLQDAHFHEGIAFVKRGKKTTAVLIV